jgi:hypothetical protein
MGVKSLVTGSNNNNVNYSGWQKLTLNSCNHNANILTTRLQRYAVCCYIRNDRTYGDKNKNFIQFDQGCKTNLPQLC